MTQQDEEFEYVKDRAYLEAEKREEMEKAWMEFEEQLLKNRQPAKIITLTQLENETRHNTVPLRDTDQTID
jgi:hypothetical protein